MEDTLDRLGQTIRSALGNAVTGHTVARGELTISAKVGDLIKVATFLRDDPVCQFINIIDVTAIDWPSREQRFDVVYHFLSPRLNRCWGVGVRRYNRVSRQSMWLANP